MKKTTLFLLIVFATLFVSAQVELVKDINSTLTTLGSNPQNLCEVNGVLFFTATDPVHGNELWKSDGTAVGTVLVKDIYAGTNNGNPQNLTNVNGTLFFSANDATNGIELWKSDGTAAGTVLVKDIYTGANPGDPYYLTDLNGTLFFRAADATNGYELWKSDGTSSGTVLVKDIYAGTNGGNPIFITNVNGTLFFSANDATNGSELWKSDGTAAGTVLVKDIYPGITSGNLQYLTNVNGSLFFSAADPVNGNELWKSDGTTAGTVLVRDINAGINSGYPRSMTNVNGNFFFNAYDATNGWELWKSDGTAAGTVLVKDIYSGTNGGYPQFLTNVNGTLFFNASDATSGYELWKSDGTAAGTVLLKDISAGTGNGYPQNLISLNGNLFFNAYDATNGSELWKSDGTTAGTVLVKDIYDGTNSGNAQFLTIVNGNLFFCAYNDANGSELWKSDGTTAGTVLVKDIYAGTNSGNPQYLTNVNGSLYFNAYDATNGTELWKSDGTSAGTVLLKDIYTGTNNGNPQYLTNVNGGLFFSAADPVNGTELWKSDGTTAGTVLVKDIYVGTNGGNPQYLTNVNGNLLFNANDGANGYELWKSDGTTAGTVLVKDIYAGTNSGYPYFLINLNNSLFFNSGDATNGYELWKSDGTAAGTVIVKDIYAGTGSGNPNNLTNVNGNLFFSANDATNGSELWKSDGTSAGTVLVKDICAGTNGGNPQYLTNVNGNLFFCAYNDANGYELWKSDGTAAGTILVKDIYAGTSSGYPQYLTNVNGSLFFSVSDATNGNELWKSDGTAAGTMIVKDILPGTAASYPNKFIVKDGILFFTAQDGINGVEIWRSDGTECGTFMVGEVVEGPGDGSIGTSFTDCNGSLFFSAKNDTTNSELWKFTPLYIITDALSNYTYCPGNNISVPYTVTGTYSSGNLFIAQLSDASGNFEAATNLDTISGLNSGIINSIIPISALAGTQYRVRVISTNPPSYYGINCGDITINALPSVNISSIPTFCDNESTYTLIEGSPVSGTYSGSGISSGNFDPATAGVGDHIVTYSYTDGFGCTNQANTTITVNPIHNFTESHSICEGETYNWQGTDYTETNTYIASYLTVNGCDSIYTLNLTVNPVYAFTENHSICEGETYTWQGSDYTEANTYIASYLTEHGCDSIYTLNLTVNPVYAFTENHSICEGETYTWQGSDYTEANTYTANYLSVNGCDSIYTLNLYVNPVYAFTENHSICQGETYTWQGTDYTEANTYIASYLSVNGCDSIYTLNLTVNPVYSFTESHSICEGETYTWQGSDYTEANTYIASYLTVNGCDSVYTLNLTVNPVYAFTENHSICQGETFNWQGTDYTEANSYIASYLSVNGCDSVYTLNLTVNPVYAFTENHSICEGETYNWQGSDYTEANSYIASYLTVNGCDSIYTLNLTVNPVYAFTENHSICEGEVYNWQGTDYSEANTYIASYLTVSGCDSIYTLILTVNPVYTFTENHSICEGETYNWQGSDYTEANSYIASYLTVNGCDSIYTLNLTVNPVYAFTENHSICEGEVYNWQGTDYSEANTYIASYLTVSGCDSIYTLILTVNPVYTFTENHSICQGETYNWQGTDYSEANTYIASYLTVSGCDSIYTLILNVNPLPILSIIGLDAQYCNNITAVQLNGDPEGGLFTGTGVNGTEFNPTVAGVGSWEIVYTYSDLNECENSTSQMVQVYDCSGIENEIASYVQVYPNPNSGDFIVRLPYNENLQIIIYDAIGKIVKEMSFNDYRSSEILVTGLVPGAYVLNVVGNKIQKNIKIIVK